MTFLPLTQKPTDIVSLLTSAGNLEFPEILAKTNIEDIPQLEESKKTFQKLRKISKQERDDRTRLLQQRLDQLSVIQSFRVFEEDYKDYKAHFSINGRGIFIKIISPHGDSWEKQTQTFTKFQASREFHLMVNEKLLKNSSELVQEPAPATKLQQLTEKEKRWQILNSLTEGECVFYKGRIGTYKGVQECATPSAWVFFTDSQITEPINPLELTQENSNNNQLTLNVSSKLNLGKVEKSVLGNSLKKVGVRKQNFFPYASHSLPRALPLGLSALCHKPGTIVNFTQRYKEYFVPPIVFWGNQEKLSVLPFYLSHLEKSAAINLEENLKQEPLLSSNLNSKIIPFRPRILEGELSKEETERIIAFINFNLRQLKDLPKIQKCSNDIIRQYLVLLDEGKGYEQLGFKNMTALLNSDLIQGSRSNLQKQWQAGRIERDCLGVEPGTIPEDHCRKLAVLKAHPEQVQKAYASAHKLAGDGQVTAKLVQQAVQKVVQNQGISFPKPKRQKKSQCDWNQNIPGNERHDKVNFCGVNNLQTSDKEACLQLEKVAKECNSTPENLIIQGLIKLVTQSMKLSDSEALVKAIEVALAEIKTDITAWHSLG